MTESRINDFKKNTENERRRTMTAPHLNDEERVKIEVLAADGQSTSRISKLVGRSPHTVQKHLEQPEVQQRVENEKEELAKMYRAQARRIVESINDKDIEKASLQQKSISSGVLLDKSLLLTGDVPTVNVQVLLDAVQVAREYHAARAEEAMQAVRRRMAAESIAAEQRAIEDNNTAAAGLKTK